METLSDDWKAAWEYTYTRSYGEVLRSTILDIQKRGKLHLFSTNHVFSGDIIRMWTVHDEPRSTQT